MCAKFSAQVENPVKEMSRLFRELGAQCASGEQRAAREAAARVAINREIRKIDPNLCVSERMAKSYWFGEAVKVDSLHMDIARRLTGVVSLEVALNELDGFEAKLSALLTRVGHLVQTSHAVRDLVPSTLTGLIPADRGSAAFKQPSPFS